MPQIQNPHGKTHVQSFVEDLRAELGVTVRLADSQSVTIRSDSTIASVRNAGCRGESVTFNWEDTVGELQEAIQANLGIEIVFLREDGSIAPVQTKLQSLRNAPPSELIIAEDRKRADWISIVGQKLISTVQEEFTNHHPFLGLYLFSSEEYKNSQAGKPARPLSSDRTIASVREKKSNEELSMHGNMIVSNLEATILDVYGIYAQVCIMNDAGKRAYTGESHDGYTLSQLNRRQQDKGRQPFRYS